MEDCICVQSSNNRACSFPDTRLWITEYAYPYQDLAATQDFYNMSADYFDNKLDYVDRYSYYGGFRAVASNVGANVSFLSNGGKLTDIGSWYLGGGATGVIPTSGSTNSFAVSVHPQTPFLVAGVAAALGALLAWS